MQLPFVGILRIGDGTHKITGVLRTLASNPICVATSGTCFVATRGVMMARVPSSVYRWEVRERAKERRR